MQVFTRVAFFTFTRSSLLDAGVFQACWRGSARWICFGEATALTKQDVYDNQEENASWNVNRPRYLLRGWDVLHYLMTSAEKCSRNTNMEWVQNSNMVQSTNDTRGQSWVRRFYRRNNSCNANEKKVHCLATMSSSQHAIAKALTFQEKVVTTVRNVKVLSAKCWGGGGIAE